MINTKLQNIIDTKSAIGNAIVNKGGTITSETPFFNYAAQIDGISTGTPQTIFAASDGSKWALTNAVNLTNVSNNVTYDFNYWQPANNSTSDPILNIGTVGANISGNIRLVQVNQVNIAQYENIVATDTLGGKYVGFNGYDSQTNPTPTNTATFNRWLLNNSATGTVIFANATFTTGTYNGPNASIIANINLNANTVVNGSGVVWALNTNNSFLYAGLTGGVVSKMFENNLVFDADTSANLYGGGIRAIAINNSNIFVGGFGLATNGNVKVYSENNLSIVNNTSVYSIGYIEDIKINNGFIYVGGFGPGFGAANISKYHESNLVFDTNSPLHDGFIKSLAINNGFVYAGGGGTNQIRKYYESNLTFVSNSVSYGGTIETIAINNGFIYVVGATNQTLQKFHESNLVRVANTADYTGTIFSVVTNNGFVYIGGAESTTNRVLVYYESNLALVENTANHTADIRALKSNNGFLYVGVSNTIEKYQQAGTVFDNKTFYNITNIKE